MAVTAVRLARPPANALHSLEGFGGQLNTNLFTRAGQERDLRPTELQELGEAINNLKLGHSRIFIRRGMRPETPKGKSAPEFVALMKTIELAQRARANVNLTWWGQGPYANPTKLKELEWPNPDFRDWPNPNRRKWPEALTQPGGLTAPEVMMRRFALIIEEARRRGFDCITHATIQNEVNGSTTDIAKQGVPNLSMRFYELLYRHFAKALESIRDPLDPSRTLREAIRIVAGDLLERKGSPESHQDAWLKYMHANMEVPREGMPSVVDAYSIHVYWEPGGGPEGFPQKLESRLDNLVKTIRNLPSDKPIYVTEYGVRKLKAKPRPGVLDGTRIEMSPECAFQHAWFNALAPQYGCVGLAKWVLYRTDLKEHWGHWGMIDSLDAKFERSPAYRVTRLFNHLIGPGWTAAGLGRSADENVITSKFAGPSGAEESVAVLNKGSAPQDVRVEGLKETRTYFGAVWNRDGTGVLNPLDPVTTGGGGAATVDVPRHGIVALSTRRLGL